MVNLNINIKNLSSKYFKKGSFIWVCKKIQEQIISQLIKLAYDYFTKIFERKNSFHLNILFEYIIDNFNKKIKDILEGENIKQEILIDPVFFKEGLTNFYFSYRETLMKINDDKIESEKFEEKILENNKNITEIYINNLLENHVARILEIFKGSYYFNNFKGNPKNTQKVVNSNGISKPINSVSIQLQDSDIGNKKNDLNSKANFFSHSQFEKLFSENTTLFNQIIPIFIEDSIMIKKLDLIELFNISSDEANRVYFKIISSFISTYFFILKSVNLLKFDNILNIHTNSKNSSHIPFTTKEGLQRIISQIKEFFPFYTKDRIFFKIILCKIMSNSNFSGLKNLIDKVLRIFPQIKSNKSLYNELKNNIEKELLDTQAFLYDSLVQINDINLNKQLKNLFLNVDWLNYETTITFRKDIRDMCHDLFYLKTELYYLLEEEKKYFEENVSSSINQAIWNKKQKKNTKYQNEMEVLNIRRLSIYTENVNSPQMIVYTIAKIFFKVRINYLFYFHQFGILCLFKHLIKLYYEIYY